MTDWACRYSIMNKEEWKHRRAGDDKAAVRVFPNNAVSGCMFESVLNLIGGVEDIALEERPLLQRKDRTEQLGLYPGCPG